MIREDRYIVLKRKDLAVLSKDEERNLMEIVRKVTLGRKLNHKEPLQCVVVEHDWPIYETVWRMIETLVIATTHHSWRLESCGEYDTVYRCTKCGQFATESFDNLEKIIPLTGCPGTGS